MNSPIAQPATSSIPNRICNCAVLRSTGLSATGSLLTATRRIRANAAGNVAMAINVYKGASRKTTAINNAT